MVPQLITALTGPLGELEQRILDARPAIERWLRMEWMEHTPMFYSSIDVRNAGFKLAPVSTNLFPGGWHHLTPPMQSFAVQAAVAALEKLFPETRHLLVIPDNGLTDLNQRMSVYQLVRILQLAGLNVRLGSIDPDVRASHVLEISPTQHMRLEPVVREGSRLQLPDFNPCAILLNNDLSEGIPGILEDLQGQIMHPALHASWSIRRKSRYFRSYEEVTKRFGKALDIDHWLLTPLTQACTDTHPDNPASVALLKEQVDALLSKVRRKYKEYGIRYKPFIMIKADHGPPGRAVSTVRDAQDVDALMRQGALLHKHDPNNPHLRTTQWVLQEGVPTSETLHQQAAEPVVYMMERYVVGAYYRSHPHQGPESNLNVPDSVCTPMAFADESQTSEPNRFYLYGVIARLALLAASYEMEDTDPNALNF